MNWLQLILKWASVALQIVATVESVLPAGTAGTVKKAVALGVLSPPAGPETDQVGGLIDHIVVALNTSGVFAKPSISGTPGK